MGMKNEEVRYIQCVLLCTQMEFYIYVHYALEHPSKIEVCNCVMKNIPPFLYVLFTRWV